MRDLAALTAGDFEPHSGGEFLLTLPDLDLPLSLTLESVREVGKGMPGGRSPFSLTFQGPPEPLLAQGIHRLERDGFGVMEIFLVPIAGRPEGVVYEAVFG